MSKIRPIRPIRPNPAASTAAEIRRECRALERMLLSKNAAYGDSALRPVRIFSRADPVEQLRVRLDDKLSRLARGAAAGEDVELDLLGYLILLRIARRNAAHQRPAAPAGPLNGLVMAPDSED